jgi:hypothetical protein
MRRSTVLSFPLQLVFSALGQANSTGMQANQKVNKSEELTYL